MAQQPTQICDNCFKSFPQSKIATHFGYCRRNIKKCPQCGQMYDINFQQDHQQQFHKMSSCQYCKKQFKPNQIKNHQNKCEAKTKFCQYCDLDVPIKDYPIHLKQCQSRTKQCDKCRKPIANKQYLIHQISCPGFVQQKPITVPATYNKYSNYDDYLKEQQKRDQIKKYQYKPTYQQPKKQISRGRQTKPQPSYTNNLYTKNQPIRQQIKKQTITSNKNIGITQPKGPNYAQINLNNKYPTNNIKYPSTTNVTEKDRNGRVQQPKQYGSLGSNKNIGSGRQAENKYGVSTKPVNQYKPNPQLYDMKRQVNKPTTQITNQRISQPQMDIINTKPSQNIGSNNYPKVQQNYRRQIPSSKDVFMKKQVEKPRQAQKMESYFPAYRAQQPNRYKVEDKNKYQQGYKNSTKPSYTPAQDYRPYQPPGRQYVPQQPAYHEPTINDHEMDQQLQKAIMASLGNMSISSSKQNTSKSSNSAYKIDDIPAELLQTDMMNESFYGKQAAIWQQIERNKKRR